MGNEATENFLQELYRLQSASVGPVGLSTLARKLRVTPGAVAQMADRLVTLSWIRRRGRGGLELAPRGRAAAVRLIRHHRLAERFLVDVLGLSLEQAHQEAHRFEHVISDEVEQRLDKLLGHPKRCPCGDPIPSASGQVREDRDLVSLETLGEGASGEIVRLSEDDMHVLRYIESLRLLPGSKVVLQHRAPFDGPLTFRAGSQTHTVGREVATRIFIRPGPSRNGVKPAPGKKTES